MHFDAAAQNTVGWMNEYVYVVTMELEKKRKKLFRFTNRLADKEILLMNIF